MGSLALVMSLLLSQTVPAEAQRPGDPRRGYDVLVNGSYVRCGMPRSLYWEAFGATPAAWRLDDRRGEDAQLPYFMSAARGRSGTTVVAANCLSCHAGWIGGRLVVGLGDASIDQTTRVAPMGHWASLLLASTGEGWELSRLLRIMDVAEPPTVTDTVGVSSADQLAAVLMAHRDPRTLAWRSEPLIPVPDALAPIKVPAGG
jgi:hypothetical protein